MTLTLKIYNVTNVTYGFELVLFVSLLWTRCWTY